MKTTIGLSKEVKKRLEDLKIHPRESYEDVIKRILKKVEMRSLDDLDLDKLISFLRKRGASKIKIFGSFARGEAGRDSDIDVIVDDLDLRGFDFFSVDRELSEVLGRDVQLIKEDSIHPLLRNRVKKEAVTIYEG